MNKYEKDLKFARKLARQAGDILEAGWQAAAGSLEVEYKGEVDLVTRFDRKSEEAITATINKERPGDAILAEEGGAEGDGARVWCIDPLDGTTNFAHGLPFFCVSISLLLENEAVVGVVYNPALKMEFYALKGGGSYFNGYLIPELEPGKKLSKALIGFGNGYDRRKNPQRYLPTIKNYMVSSQGIRRTGSAAFDCCLVAKGWLDGYVEVNLYPWDLAAGSLIASEAGARVSDVNGSEFNLFAGRIMMGKPHVHEEMVELARKKDIFKREFSKTERKIEK
ncbi:MAG: inositol monophosphatase family protein [Deltaproteobacteria bacterium]|jgi:myo-inositol-1(or 4)-monophosphatase|nr:inositol monophosphatase family protein [Deltaproteobacteria bacterium]